MYHILFSFCFAGRAAAEAEPMQRALPAGASQHVHEGVCGKGRACFAAGVQLCIW